MPATGQPIALNYGFCWITGQRLQYRTLENTNNDHEDHTRIGMWALGEGEMDGLEELWDSQLNRLLYTSENDAPANFHFHRGCDAVIGDGGLPSSTGPDQGVDSFWQNLPAGIQPLHYHRIAYYAMQLKLVVNNPPNPLKQSDGNAWTDLNPVGLWRGLRCRLFDSSGATVGYGFTTNPAWHYVDVLLRRKLFPEYALDLVNGPDDLPDAVRARFDWGAIAAAAAYYDVVLDNGNRRFQGNYSFSQATSLQAVLGQILQVCRSYAIESAGRFALRCDQRRASVFTLSRANTLSFSTNDVDLHSAPNRFIAKFRDIEIPSAADVVSITCPDHGSPTVTTLNPHPFAPGDRIVIGGTGTKYDTGWVVAAVPGSSFAAVVYSMVLTSRGSNYPSAIGAGGKIGLLYTRFKERAPEFNHHRNQYARGAVGLNLPRQRNKARVETDFATCTFDQAARISHGMVRRALGPDTVPYLPPVNGEAELPFFAASDDADAGAASGNLACGIEAGDIVSIDETLSDVYAGDYEVLKAEKQADGTGPAGRGMARQPQAGRVKLQLGPYSDENFPDSSDPAEAGWDIVPGSLPGNATDFTLIDLADGGVAAFLSGSGADGTTFSLPATGFNTANLLAWAAPQGYIETNGQLHFIFNCGVDPTRLLHLLYDDGDGNQWHGDLNWLALTWRSRSSVRQFQSGGISFVELTLAGGEIICFGSGAVGQGAAVPIPPGYTAANSFLLAFPRSARNANNPGNHTAHGFVGCVDAAGVAHHFYQDGEGNHWEGDSNVFTCSWQNNRGTISGPSNGWITIPLATGNTLALGGFNIFDANLNGARPTIYSDTPLHNVTMGGKLPIPAHLATTTLQTIACPAGFQIVDHPAHGVKACLVDGDLNVLCSFEDGEGTTWYGTSEVFALICDAPGSGDFSGPTGGGGGGPIHPPIIGGSGG